MKHKYFADCNTVEALKKEYRRLLQIHHPDNGGDEDIMKEINLEYDRLFNAMKNMHNSKAENKENQNTEQPEDWRNLINELMKLNGLIIEICGSWIWLSGETYSHKATIKEMGFKWASKKKLWYLGELQGKRTSSMDMKEIRSKYGSEFYISKPVCAIGMS